MCSIWIFALALNVGLLAHELSQKIKNKIKTL